LTFEERGESSSHRELLAISRTLGFMKKSGSLRRTDWTTLWWLTDNQNVEKMIAKGSGKIKIMRLVLEILRSARDLKFQVEPVWVSRDNPFLQKADAISKGINADNWAISEGDAAQLSVVFGEFSIDLFASHGNTKCKRFYTRSAEEGCLGVDAFAQSWAGECTLAATPVSLIMRTIRKAAVTPKLRGALVIPLWKTAKFWTFAYRDGVHLNGLFAEMQIVRMKTTAWELSRKEIIGGKEIKFLVLRFSGKVGVEALESVKGAGRCFLGLFGRKCKVCW
jgi:hypothetical protein